VRDRDHVISSPMVSALSAPVRYAAPNPCRAPLYSCKNDRCVMMHEVNDGKDDCLDQSDEGTRNRTFVSLRNKRLGCRRETARRCESAEFLLIAAF